MFALSIKGPPRTWLDAALANGDAAGAWAAPHELGKLELADALALCLLLREQHPSLWDRAAARWAARFALEADAVTLPDLGLAVAALHALNGAECHVGIEALAALAALCRQHGRHDIVAVLEPRSCGRLR